MKIDIKRLIVFGLVLILVTMLFFMAYLGFSKQNIDLEDYSRYEDRVEKKEVARTHNGKKCFILSFKNSDKRFTVYRYSRDYKDLLAAINVNDTLAVHYVNNSHSLYNDVIQLEKGHQIVLNKYSYEAKYRIILYTCLAGGILVLGISYLFFTKKIYK